jgi:hypothetical protein
MAMRTQVVYILEGTCELQFHLHIKVHRYREESFYYLLVLTIHSVCLPSFEFLVTWAYGSFFFFSIEQRDRQTQHIISHDEFTSSQHATKRSAGTA